MSALPAAEFLTTREVVGRRLARREATIERARMLELRDQYGDLLAQLIDIFADTTPDALAGLESALERDDREAIRGVAHSLKGACQNVGATAMAELCRALEADPASAATYLPGLRDALEPTLAVLRDVVAAERHASGGRSSTSARTTSAWMTVHSATRRAWSASSESRRLRSMAVSATRVGFR